MDYAGPEFWTVSRAKKEPLLRFIIDGLEECGCHILHATDASLEPFLVSFETPAGERHGIVCYAFFANSRRTKNRPEDEHRFQLKLGSDEHAILHVYHDPLEVITTILVGIDTERGFLVGADPVLHNPSPMFKSVEFKREHAENIVKNGWHVWERASHRSPDNPTEALVGATRSRILDYVRFERAARGLDQGHRQLLAEKFQAGISEVERGRKSEERHHLVRELGLNEAALFDLIDDTARLKMAVRGWVAEVHLEAALRDVPGVTDCARINEEGKPDIRLRYKGSRPILVECKNVLRVLSREGLPRLDFQRTRAAKSDPCSRYYRPEEFSLLAACLHAVTESWEFRYVPTAELPPHKKCEGRIRNNLVVGGGCWTEQAAKALEVVASAA